MLNIEKLKHKNELKINFKTRYFKKIIDKENVGLTLRKPSQIHLNIYQICEPVPEILFPAIFGK
jgi:hypothetical protein